MPQWITTLAGRTKTLGIVIPDITNPFFSQIIRDAECGFWGPNYSPLIFNTDDDRERLPHFRFCALGGLTGCFSSSFPTGVMFPTFGTLPMRGYRKLPRSRT